MRVARQRGAASRQPSSTSGGARPHPDRLHRPRGVPDVRRADDGLPRRDGPARPRCATTTCHASLGSGHARVRRPPAGCSPPVTCPTALVIGTDANAIGVLAAFEEAGVRVPTTCRSSPSTASSRPAAPTPPLATVQPPSSTSACSRRSSRWSGPPASASSPAPYRVPGRLMRRGTCGCDGAARGPPAPRPRRSSRASSVAAEPIGHRPSALRERASGVAGGRPGTRLAAYRLRGARSPPSPDEPGPTASCRPSRCAP